MKLKLFVGAMLAVSLIIATTPRGWAGPDPSTTRYAPVRTMVEAEGIRPGTRIAMVCGKCGAVTTMIADKDQSYLRGFTCQLCKQKFVVRQDPHGGTRGDYICEDDSGHRAQLLQAK
jgi:hypothetical protein